GIMRTVVIILVIIGTIASIGLGIKWSSDFDTYKTEIAAVEELKSDPVAAQALKDMEKLKNCAYALIVGGIIALVSVFLMGKIGKIAAVIILASAIVPAILAPISLVFTFFFVIAGILAFFVKPKVQAVKAA
ncbi:MAG TPA: hypothetical protein VN456_17135, partial [Desulfosporosinus sp.]|nr:hypothetical protein [Desulfosporosinus sp.]